MLEYVFKQGDYDYTTRKRIERGRSGIDSPADRKPLNTPGRPEKTEEREKWADPKETKAQKKKREDDGVNSFSKILKGLAGQ